MKINFACGKQTWPDFYCIDAVQHPKASRPLDLIHAFQFAKGRLKNCIPLDDGCADELHAYHFIEHVYAWEALEVILEFKRLLKPSGRLVLELPDIEKCAQNLINGSKDQLCMWGLYGDPGWKDEFMCHRWGYTPKTICELLRGAGFGFIEVLEPQTHGKRVNRDMRVEASF